MYLEQQYSKNQVYCVTPSVDIYKKNLSRFVNICLPLNILG